MLVHLGDPVAQGRTLVSLDAPELVHEVEAARAELAAACADSARARAELVQAAIQLERRRGAADVFTREEVEALEARHASARAALESAEATVGGRLARLNGLLHRTSALDVKAPFAGLVTWFNARVGERVRAGQVVAKISGAGEIWFRFAVSVPESGWLTPGSRVEIRVDGMAARLQAVVRHVAPEADPITGLRLAEAALVPDGHDPEGRPPIGAPVWVRPESP